MFWVVIERFQGSPIPSTHLQLLSSARSLFQQRVHHFQNFSVVVMHPSKSCNWGATPPLAMLFASWSKICQWASSLEEKFWKNCSLLVHSLTPPPRSFTRVEADPLTFIFGCKKFVSQYKIHISYLETLSFLFAHFQIRISWEWWKLRTWNYDIIKWSTNTTQRKMRKTA